MDGGRGKGERLRGEVWLGRLVIHIAFFVLISIMTKTRRGEWGKWRV